MYRRSDDSVVKLNRTDATLDLSHEGKGSWRRKVLMGTEGSLYTGDKRWVGVGILPGQCDSSEPRSESLIHWSNRV